MRVGRYIFPPSKFRYASQRFDPDTGQTEIIICLDDDMQLSQWVSKSDDVETMLKRLDSAAEQVTDIDMAEVTGVDPGAD